MGFVWDCGDDRSGGTHLKDGNPFECLLWEFLKVIVERDWLRRKDVDECLDGVVLFLT